MIGMVLLCSAAWAALASGAPYALTRATLDGGGGVSQGGVYALTGTIGQPDANIQHSAGGDISLGGGFWARLTGFLFKDGFEGP